MALEKQIVQDKIETVAVGVSAIATAVFTDTVKANYQTFLENQE